MAGRFWAGGRSAARSATSALLVGHKGVIRTLVFSPDEALVSLASSNGITIVRGTGSASG